MPYKTAVLRPHKAEIKTGRGKSAVYTETSLEEVLEAILGDATALADMVEWQLGSNPELRKEVSSLVKERPSLSSAKVGEYLNYRLPKELLPNPSGASRFERMFQARLVTETLSWNERSQASLGERSGHVSQGWKRTADTTRPTDLAPKLPLSAADEKYFKMVGNPLSDGVFALDMVVCGVWHRLHFRFDCERFSSASKVCAPDVVVKNGRVQFNFAVEYPYHYNEVSSEYRVGIDVGKVQPATVVVVNARGEIVHSTTLSRRIASLKNSIEATSRQVCSLQRKNRPYEAALHRRANIGKKRELAVLVGQEVAEVQHAWGNASVVVEDLSWIANTMQSGRWNRGDVVHWVEHFCSLNGGLVFRRNAAYTSQVCHVCGKKGRLRDRDFACVNEDCANHGTAIDRDVNAAANIAQRATLDTVSKYVATRKRKRKTKGVSSKQTKLQTPAAKQTLHYPGRDRTKARPTPKRPKRRHKRILSLKEVSNNCGTSGALLPTVSLDVSGEVNRAWDCNKLPECSLQLE